MTLIERSSQQVHEVSDIRQRNLGHGGRRGEEAEMYAMRRVCGEPNLGDRDRLLRAMPQNQCRDVDER